MKKNILENKDKRLEVIVFRSNKYIYAQVIDEGKILESYSSLNLKKTHKEKVNKTQEAKLVGIELAKKLLDKKHKKVRFNKRSYIYLGRIKAFTEGMREGGLEV